MWARYCLLSNLFGRRLASTNLPLDFVVHNIQPGDWKESPLTPKWVSPAEKDYLSSDAFDAPSLETSKAEVLRVLDQALGNMMELWCPCSFQRSWTRWPWEICSNSKDSMNHSMIQSGTEPFWCLLLWKLDHGWIHYAVSNCTGPESWTSMLKENGNLQLTLTWNCPSSHPEPLDSREAKEDSSRRGNMIKPIQF